uniref:hypothetical protein n=1 Tax=Mesorhizobium sp. WSM4875 TaxID=3038539 RepID=UPI002417B5E4|nr:hypothetical protein [Mesorhizobium sp. WSM4875]WIE94697.1 hypothetical protein P9270_030800 [Mesorhizobium sp. WSM4875]
MSAPANVHSTNENNGPAFRKSPPAQAEGKKENNATSAIGCAPARQLGRPLALVEGNIVEDDDVAWVKFGGKLGARPVRLVSRVLVEVVSMTTSRVKAWSKNGLRRPIQFSRAFRMSGRCCPLARSVFFVTEASADVVATTGAELFHLKRSHRKSTGCQFPCGALRANGRIA